MRRFLRLGAALWLAAMAGWAVDWKSLKPEGYVSDFAGVVDPASKVRLEAYGAELKGKTGVEIALVTVPSLEGEPLGEVANTISRAWGVGQQNGVLLLMAIGDRRSRLKVGESVKAMFPHGWDWDASMRKEMAPALRSQQYGEAMMAAAETVGTAISRARHVSLNTVLPRKLRPTLANSLPRPFLPIAISELALFVFLIALARRKRRAASGGGFGSFDSPDSFGGFGGGEGAPSGHSGSSGGWR
jgi:uncharacterized protein